MRIACLLLPLILTACSKPEATVAADPVPVAQGGCLASGEGRFEATLRGDLQADIAWDNARMECDGGLRPDGLGLRISVVGSLPTAEPTVGAGTGANAGAGATAVGSAGTASPRRLRFILGIDLRDTDTGPAQVLPTNLTLILEGENQLFATRGDDKCAVEDLRREPLEAGLEQVSGRGYCLGQAADLAGERHVLVDTFSFTALVRIEADLVAPEA